ncbi:MAG: efflux RND transporter periplasmic adaptor subunit [Verrucomicrobia bacterium]|nr:efflux RND transporter periplasmic adaptor subunit [Verrucomicrobiota bacterium]
MRCPVASHRAIVIPLVTQLKAIFLFVAIALVTGCNPPEAQKGGKKDSKTGIVLPTRTVVVAPIETRSMERSLGVIGSLAAIDQATLSVKASGRLQSLSVDLGSRVKRGDLVAQIEPVDYELRVRSAEALLAQARARLGLPLVGADDEVKAEETSTVRQAKAALLEAQRQRERIRELTKRGISPQSELEMTEANYDIAFNRHLEAVEDIRQRQALLQQRRAEVEIARQLLVDTRILAPFDGIVQERRASLGEFLNPAAPVVTLVKVDPLRLRVEVPERSAVGVRAGLALRLTTEGDTNRHMGTITRLSPAITELNRMLVVEADIPNVAGALRPGTFVRADIVLAEVEPAVVVPKSALITFAGIEKVFLVKDGKAVEKNVTSGRREGNFIEVVGGVKPGDTVVLNPGSLQNGQPVTLEQTAVGGQRSAKSGEPTAGGGKLGKPSGP